MTDALLCLPFALLLLGIALFPMLESTRHLWEHNRNKLLYSLGLGLAGLGVHLATGGAQDRMFHAALEYAAFIALIASLYIVSGGIYITGAFAGYPHVNTAFLGLGALLANLLGTTGASMVLLRPLLRANQHRKHTTHIVIFFIFTVSNCGGLLTPLGDPPLYLGFLRGVPFEWTLGLWPEWLFSNLTLLFLFHLIDSRAFTREDLATRDNLVDQIKAAARPLHVRGHINFLFLAAILLTLLGSSYAVTPLFARALPAETAQAAGTLFQAAAMAVIAFASYRLTQPGIHAHNEFSFGPIKEVAAIFSGIFAAMVPALVVLEAHAPALGLSGARHYFWATGILSSLLDNAPTYLTFATLAAGQAGVSSEHLLELVRTSPAPLVAISCGSVLMGALTYIGNGPNFMVKAVAEHQGVKMPGFLGYLKWSCAVLLPLFLLMTFIFFK